jgi:hypothetical protein
MSARATAQAKKDKRNKIVLVVLAAVLGVLLIIQGPTLLSAFGGGSSSDEDTAADATGAEGTASREIALPPPVQLANSDIPQPAGLDELTTINRFGQDFSAFEALVVDFDEGSGSDPTNDQPPGDASTGEGGSSSTDGSGSPDGDGADGSDTGSSGDSGSGSAGGDTGDSTPEADPDSGVSTSGTGAVASLSINDITQDVAVGASFPSSNPVFKLVMIDGDAIKVGLVSGAFSTGTTTISVDLGESRTLVSQPDGTRYRVKYVGRRAG